MTRWTTIATPRSGRGAPLLRLGPGGDFVRDVRPPTRAPSAARARRARARRHAPARHAALLVSAGFVLGLLAVLLLVWAVEWSLG